MRTNNESPKEAKGGSFGKNEKQPKSMTKVGDKRHELAGRMSTSDAYHKANARYKKTGTHFGDVLSLQRKLEREDFKK